MKQKHWSFQLENFQLNNPLSAFFPGKDVFRAFSKLPFVETFFSWLFSRFFPGPSWSPSALWSAGDTEAGGSPAAGRAGGGLRSKCGLGGWGQNGGGWVGGGYLSTWSVIVGSCTRRKEALRWSWRGFYCNIKPAADSLKTELKPEDICTFWWRCRLELTTFILKKQHHYKISMFVRSNQF